MHMTAITLGEVCGELAGDYANLVITDLVADSRDVKPGAAFVALPGATAHGLSFAAEARANGAVVTIYDPEGASDAVAGPSIAIPNLRQHLGKFAQRFYGRKATRPTVTGITGTNGKTTVAYLLAQALTHVGRTSGYIGTLGFGVPPQLITHRLTTPDCLSLHREIALMPVADVALEVSSHGLAQDRLDGIDVTGAVFTNLSHDHLDAHGSLEAYAQVKTLLFKRPELDHAVVNLDDAFCAKLLAEIADSVRVLGVSATGAPAADIAGKTEQHDLDGQRIRVSGAYGPATIKSPLIGAFNASNLLLTLGALLNLDVPIREACDALGQCVAPPGRMEVFGGGQQPWVIVDYAHTPDALSRALAAVAEVTDGEIWCVFGCGGDRDRQKRIPMGAAASRAARIVLTDDNPRSEDPAEIISAIQSGLAEHPHVHVEHDRAAAISFAVTRAKAGDVVLVAGRGHESLQIRKHGTVVLDDRQVVAGLLGSTA